MCPASQSKICCFSFLFFVLFLSAMRTISRCYSAALHGINAYEVTIETRLDRSQPKYFIVGLAEKAVKESFSRMLSAIKSCGYRMPGCKITQNLAPADIPKEGTGFDLSLALGVLAGNELVDAENLQDFICIGELALDGSLRPSKGILPIALGMKHFRQTKLIVPKANASEAAMPGFCSVWGAENLLDAVSIINGNTDIEPEKVDVRSFFTEPEDRRIDFSEVKGQAHVKRALEVAAAGGHNIVLIGPPGSGKSMLAKRFPTILPALTLEEAMETTAIYSVYEDISETGLITRRPFRSPHHTVSDSALVGGGRIPRPGEVSLAHNGVLFLDEFPEFKKNVLEVLRQPLEDGQVTISRALTSLTYPASFMLVAAMNPCPCGYASDPHHDCSCSIGQIHHYLSRISGPLLDRIDLHVDVPPVSYDEISDREDSENSHSIRERVSSARNIQTERFRHYKRIHCNAQMAPRDIKRYCELNDECRDLLKIAILRLGLSARAYTRILKVARTIADLDVAEQIGAAHISEAIHYRNLDRHEGLY
jgi:magnesium chelatase family protein